MVFIDPVLSYSTVPSVLSRSCATLPALFGAPPHPFIRSCGFLGHPEKWGFQLFLVPGKPAENDRARLPQAFALLLQNPTSGSLLEADEFGHDYHPSLVLDICGS